MNKVSIINFNLHKRYLLEDQKDYLPEPSFKSTTKGRNKSPQQTLKKLIKKGLVHYINPFIRPKSGKRIAEEKQNLKSIELSQQSSISRMNRHHKSLIMNKAQTSASVFACSRGHCGATNPSSSTQPPALPARNSLQKSRLTTSKYRIRTQQKQNTPSSTSFLYKKPPTHDWDDFCPVATQAFRQFRNISEQTQSRVNVENERRNFKLNQVHKVKYDDVWRRYPVVGSSGGKDMKGVGFSRGVVVIK